MERNKRENAALGCGDPRGGYTEETLVEQPAIALLGELGWETVNAYHEFDHGASRKRSNAIEKAFVKELLRRSAANFYSLAIGKRAPANSLRFG